MGCRFVEKSFDEILKLNIGTIRSYISHADNSIRFNIEQISKEKESLERLTERDRLSAMSRIEKLRKSLDWYSSQLPRYKKALEQIKASNRKAEKPSESKKSCKYKAMLDFTNNAVKKAMEDDSVMATEVEAKENQFVVAISPFIGNWAVNRYKRVSAEGKKELLDLIKQLEKADKNEQPKILETITTTRSIIYKCKRDMDNVLYHKKKSPITNKYEMAEYLYRLERHILFNKGKSLGNVREIRYTDGVIWLLVDSEEMLDPGMIKQMTSACLSCYLPSSHAVLMINATMPTGYLLWERDSGDVMRFAMKYEDLIYSHTYTNVWHRVKQEINGSRKKQKLLKCLFNWWSPVDPLNMTRCKPKLSTLEDY